MIRGLLDRFRSGAPDAERGDGVGGEPDGDDVGGESDGRDVDGESDGSDVDGEPGGGDDPDGDDDRDTAGTLWDLIPRWQYNVETGGSTREDQERAIAEVQAQAAAIEAAESAGGGDAPPDPAQEEP